MIAIGIGSKTTASVADVAAIIKAAQTHTGVTCAMVATLARGAADVAIVGAARECGLKVQLLAAADLAARSDDCITHSGAALKAHGVASLAEAAALAACGPGSRLILPRIQHAHVTAAVAASADDDLEEASP